MDATERVTEDDRAALAGQQWLDRALAAQRRAAATPAPAWTPGVCRNCGEACTGGYCDAACREDHERREARGRP